MYIQELAAAKIENHNQIYFNSILRSQNSVNIKSGQVLLLRLLPQVIFSMPGSVSEKFESTQYLIWSDRLMLWPQKMLGHRMESGLDLGIGSWTLWATVSHYWNHHFLSMILLLTVWWGSWSQFKIPVATWMNARVTWHKSVTGSCSQICNVLLRSSGQI